MEQKHTRVSYTNIWTTSNNAYLLTSQPTINYTNDNIVYSTVCSSLPFVYGTMEPYTSVYVTCDNA